MFKQQVEDVLELILITPFQTQDSRKNTVTEFKVERIWSSKQTTVSNAQ